jgi:hypothetical protein
MWGSGCGFGWDVCTYVMCDVIGDERGAVKSAFKIMIALIIGYG